jgi:hypothetical protein
MRLLVVLALLGLSACGFLGQAPSPAPPVIAIKHFTKAEQREIADERLKLEHSSLCELTATGVRPMAFPDAVLVFDDWARMRADIRAAGAAR